MEKTKLYKILNPLLIFSVAVLAIYLLISLLHDKADQLLSYLGHLKQKEQYLLLSGAILLMFVNWLLEGIKWGGLLNRHLYLDNKSTIKSLLAGISIGLFTPNRLGELGGRLIYVPKSHRSSALYLTSVSSISQLLLTFILGLIGLNYFFDSFSEYLPAIGKFDFLMISLLGLFILLFAYFTMQNLRKLHAIIFPFLKKKIDNLPEISTYSKLQLIAWSFLRYQVFVLQFYLLMLCFSSDLHFISTYFALSISYLVSAVVPSNALTEIPLRMSLSYFIFDALALNPEAAMLASLLMWLINIFLPALTAVYLLKDIQLFSTKKALLMK